MAMPGLVAAQTTIGGLGAYHTDFEAIGIGAYATIALPQLHENISIVPNFIFFFPDNVDYFELNADMIYSFPVAEDAPVSPFALAGINIGRFSVPSVNIPGFGTVGGGSSTEVGLNLGGGVAIPMESIRPVVGAKFEIQDGSGFVLFAGVGFAVGG